MGVKVLFGQVDPTPLREGLNIVLNPLYDVVVMDGRVGKHSAKYDAASKDLQAVHVEMVLNYRLHPDRAPEVYKSIGLEYSAVIIDPAAQEVLKANTATHNAAEILLRRPAIKADIQRDLTVWLAKYGVELKEASLANIRFDQNYEKAIEAKQIEEQKAEQKRYELIQAQRQAEIIAAAAKGRGDAAREEAKGVAEATRIKGDAEATYNARVSASLTQTAHPAAVPLEVGRAPAAVHVRRQRGAVRPAPGRRGRGRAMGRGGSLAHAGTAGPALRRAWPLWVVVDRRVLADGWASSGPRSGPPTSIARSRSDLRQFLYFAPHVRRDADRHADAAPRHVRRPGAALAEARGARRVRLRLRPAPGGGRRPPWDSRFLVWARPDRGADLPGHDAGPAPADSLTWLARFGGLLLVLGGVPGVLGMVVGLLTGGSKERGSS